MTTFDDMFAPILSQGTVSGNRIEMRSQQRHLGWGVVDSINDQTNLIGEARTGCGKSFAYLVPAIFAARGKDGKRTVVSTETTALMDQLTKKDLPALDKIYGPIKYRSLKGRSWYLCRNRAAMFRSRNDDVKKVLELLQSSSGDPLYGKDELEDGERPNIEKFVGYEIADDLWKFLRGDAEFCADNKCQPSRCFSARARELALDADIVVTTHAMLRTDADMREDGNSPLGEVDILVVDEAHTLESVLVDGWTETLQPWEISQARTNAANALMTAASIMGTRDDILSEEVAFTFDHLDDALKSIRAFYELRVGTDEWNRQNFPLSLVSLSGSPSADLLAAMTDYETNVPMAIESLIPVWDRAAKVLNDAIEEASERRIKGARDMRKGLRSLNNVKSVLATMLAAMKTKDGVVVAYGIPHGVIIDGIVRMDKTRDIAIRVVPLDVSKKCAELVWKDRVSILLSATLTDPTDGTFNYSVASLGLTGYRTLMVDSPFAYASQQLVYTTPATDPVVDVKGARFSIDELVDVIRASNGRTLVLFTARAELNYAKDELEAMKRRGDFPWEIYVQQDGISKQKLVEQFKTNEHSVLLATKSFFTGVDFPGATCTTVALCKFPLPQFNALCKQRIAWWRSRGFANWYERESLLVFAQAAGRLIRSTSDHGVVALLDQRVANPRENVARTAEIGIRGLGSTVTSSLDDVRAFLGEKAMS